MKFRAMTESILNKLNEGKEMPVLTAAQFNKEIKAIKAMVIKEFGKEGLNEKNVTKIVKSVCSDKPEIKTYVLENLKKDDKRPNIPIIVDKVLGK